VSFRLKLTLYAVAVVMVALVTFNMSFPTVVAVELTGGMTLTMLLAISANRRRGGRL
jgi:hypothetical protein